MFGVPHTRGSMYLIMPRMITIDLVSHFNINPTPPAALVHCLLLVTNVQFPNDLEIPVLSDLLELWLRAKILV